MTKKTRLIILIVCAIIFFIMTPYMVLYSLGYRVDFKKLKIVVTGGIYIKALPQEVNISIDSKINDKTGILSYSIFEQNLLPGKHNISVKKDGYYDYQKNLDVKENEVTKLEHVILFKEKIPFILLENDIDYFSMAPDENSLLEAKIDDKKISFALLNVSSQQKKSFSLPFKNAAITDLKWSSDSKKALLNIKNNYFILDFSSQAINITPLPFLIEAKEVFLNPRSENPAPQILATSQNSNEIFFIKNKNLYSNKKNLPIIKNVITYQITNNSITWLSYDGFLYNSDITGKIISKITLRVFSVKKNSLYNITIISAITFLREDESLFLLNQKSKIFENFYSPAQNIKTSPDGQKISYHNDHEILLSYLNSDNLDKIFLNRFSEKISDCYWLNDDYLIFNLGNKVVISETDYRGNVNTVSLQETMSLADGKTVIIENPKIYFNQQDKKLYILTGGKLLNSEKLIP